MEPAAEEKREEPQPEEAKMEISRQTVQPTIIIGPNTLPRSATGGTYRRRQVAPSDGQFLDYDYDEGDELDEDEFEGMMLNGGGGFYGGDDFFPPTTWDLVIKNVTPKLPQIDQVLQKYQLKNRKFFTTQNECLYNPPFMMFYTKQRPEDDEMNMANFNEKLMIPHQFELMRFFESFHMMRFPKEAVLMLKRKCKVKVAH